MINAKEAVRFTRRLQVLRYDRRRGVTRSAGTSGGPALLHLRWVGEGKLDLPMVPPSAPSLVGAWHRRRGTEEDGGR